MSKFLGFLWQCYECFLISKDLNLKSYQITYIHISSIKFVDVLSLTLQPDVTMPTYPQRTAMDHGNVVLLDEECPLGLFMEMIYRLSDYFSLYVCLSLSSPHGKFLFPEY